MKRQRDGCIVISSQDLMKVLRGVNCTNGFAATEKVLFAPQAAADFSVVNGTQSRLVPASAACV